MRRRRRWAISARSRPRWRDAAVASRKKWTVPASVTVAQWAVESAWGASMPPGSNNPFGIKAVGDQPAVESPTREVINGESVTITAPLPDVQFAVAGIR